jgi:hypothetical protein
VRFLLLAPRTWCRYGPRVRGHTYCASSSVTECPECRQPIGALGPLFEVLANVVRASAPRHLSPLRRARAGQGWEREEGLEDLAGEPLRVPLAQQRRQIRVMEILRSKAASRCRRLAGTGADFLPNRRHREHTRGAAARVPASPAWKQNKLIAPF